MKYLSERQYDFDDQPEFPDLSADENEFLIELFCSMSENLLKVANMRLSDLDYAEDVVQETFLAAIRNVEKVMQSENPKGWIMNALKYKVKDAQKLKHKYTLLEPDVISAFVDMQNVGEQYDFELREIIMKDEYKILRLIYGAGYKTHEVAEMLGIKVEACKKRVQVAKRKLAQELLK